MTDPAPQPAQPGVRGAPDAVADLTPEEWLLVRLRDELYEGQWAEMQTDLEHRLQGKPYIFKLVHRIQDDLQRIARLRNIEAALRVDLRDYLP